MTGFQITTGLSATEMRVGYRSLQQLGTAIRNSAGSPSRVVVVTDDYVRSLWRDALEVGLASGGFVADWFTVPPGESSKSFEQLERIHGFLAEREVDRDGLIVAFGGGVVSDLAGFAAATWMRGIRFVICPTTLECAVDASIGGKTAINIAGGKNLVGAFHAPVLVVTDPELLRTLDSRDVRAGLSESVKHALISTDEFVSWHETHLPEILALDPGVMSELIVRNIRVKAAFVESDARETRELRVMLNFGHTIGHAIEDACAYRLRHGECVGLGMIAACHLSQRMGLLDGATVGRVEALLRASGLPMCIDAPVDIERMMSTLRRDKKARGGKVRFILLGAIGRPVVRDDVPQEAVRDVCEALMAR